MSERPFVIFGVWFLVPLSICQREEGGRQETGKAKAVSGWVRSMKPVHHLCGGSYPFPPTRPGGAHVRLSSLIQFTDVFGFSLFRKREGEREREYHHRFLQRRRLRYVLRGVYCVRGHMTPLACIRQKSFGIGPGVR